MFLKDTPIQRKLMTVILLTCAAVLLVTCSAFFVYEFLTFRHNARQQLSTLGKMIAANSTGALAFDVPTDAQEILSALKAEQHIVRACLYRGDVLYSKYPPDLPDGAFPATRGKDD